MSVSLPATNCSAAGFPPSPSPRVCSNSCPLGWRCRWNISSSVSLLLSSVFPSIIIFPNKLTLRIRRSKYWSFSISPSNEKQQKQFLRVGELKVSCLILFFSLRLSQPPSNMVTEAQWWYKCPGRCLKLREGSLPMLTRVWCKETSLLCVSCCCVALYADEVLKVCSRAGEVKPKLFCLEDQEGRTKQSRKWRESYIKQRGQEGNPEIISSLCTCDSEPKQDTTNLEN